MTLTNLLDGPLPVAQEPRGDRAAGVAGVLDQEVADQLDVLGLAERLEVDHLEVAALGEVAGLVEDEGRAAAHAGGEVAAGRADDDGDAAGHVLAAVVAGALDDGQRAAVADAEPLAGAAAEEGPAAGRAVERDVADEDVVLGDERRDLGREDDDLAAGEPLADVVVGVALERQRDPPRHEGAEALAGRAV